MEIRISNLEKMKDKGKAKEKVGGLRMRIEKLERSRELRKEEKGENGVKERLQRMEKMLKKEKREKRKRNLVFKGRKEIQSIKISKRK